MQTIKPRARFVRLNSVSPSGYWCVWSPEGCGIDVSFSEAYAKWKLDVLALSSCVRAFCFGEPRVDAKREAMDRAGEL